MEVWTAVAISLISVAVGVFLHFGLDLLKERKERQKYLMDLLRDLEFNKKLADEENSWGYHTLGYIDAKGAKHLYSLPDGLRTKIYEAQAKTSLLYERIDPAMKHQLIRELRSLLEEIIPEFRNHLKIKRGQG